MPYSRRNKPKDTKLITAARFTPVNEKIRDLKESYQKEKKKKRRRKKEEEKNV